MVRVTGTKKNNLTRGRKRKKNLKKNSESPPTLEKHCQKTKQAKVKPPHKATRGVASGRKGRKQRPETKKSPITRATKKTS